MSYNNSPRPIYQQSNELRKAASEGNKDQADASLETFRRNQVFGPQYREMEDRATIGVATRLRRYPDGKLDTRWVAFQVMDVLRRIHERLPVLPVELALLTTLFPMKFRYMEPQQAAIIAQMSDTEKEDVEKIVAAHMAEAANWNAGSGGSSIPGRSFTYGA